MTDLLLLDVTPLSLGIETMGGVATVLIERNTTIPTKKTESFSTAEDNQTQVEIMVFQGERPMARDNKALGNFRLVGIPPAPRGVPKVEVTFDLDANGILHVTAQDMGTGKKQEIRITSSSGLTEDEIQKMVTEAEDHAEQDQQRKEKVEAHNQLDSLIWQTEKTLTENKEKMESGDVESLEKAIAEAKEKLKSEDVEELKNAHQQLMQASHKLAETLYKPQGQEAEPAAGAEGGEETKAKVDDEGVIDAEVVD